MGKLSSKDNPNYASIAQGLKKIVKGGATTSIDVKSLLSLFPRKKTWPQEYYTYTGSSFVPPCTEGRIRLVYKTPIKLSENQYKAIYGLYEETGKYIWNNYRPIQNNTFVQVWSSKMPGLPVPNVIPTTTKAPYY
jgi:carbonic anhydrase